MKYGICLDNYCIFISSDTGWQTQIQPLHEAELKYSNPGNALNPQWWNDLNMTNVGSESQETKYYDEESAEDHYIGGQAADPWVVANAGTGNDAVDDRSPQFEGGFAGNCDGGLSWQYQEDAERGDPLWECRGAGEEIWGSTATGPGNGDRPVIPIPDFETAVHLPGTSVEDGEREIGLTVFGFENIDFEDRDDYVPDVDHYPDASESEDEDAELTHVGVQCWAGSLDERPEDADENFDEDVDRTFSDYTSIETDEPTSVNQAVTVDNEYSGYACEWAYETSDNLGEEGDAMARGQAEDVKALHQSQYSSEWDAVADRFDLDDRQFP